MEYLIIYTCTPTRKKILNIINYSTQEKIILFYLIIIIFTSNGDFTHKLKFKVSFLNRYWVYWKLHPMEKGEKEKPL